MAVEITSYPFNLQKKTSILTIRGRLDSMSASDLKEQLETQIKAGVYYFLLNLEELEYLSSAGLREIMSARREIDKKNGGIVISINPTDKRDRSPHEVLELSGLVKIFKIFGNEREALNALSSIIAAELSQTK